MPLEKINTTFNNNSNNGASTTQQLVANAPHDIVKAYKSIINNKTGWTKFLDTFSNEDDCLELYFRLKFAEHNCLKCGRLIVSNYVRISRNNKNGVPKKCYRCRSCHTHIYPLSNSIFNRSTVDIRLLFFIIFLMSNPKSGVSAADVELKCGISYKTAHRIMMLIRSILRPSVGFNKMKGTIEIDEAFIGSGGSNIYNWSNISTRKQPIIGMVERETKQCRLFLVNNRSLATIRKLIWNNIEQGSTIYTDSWKGYNGLSQYYQHEIIDHSKGEYVRGGIHTNSIEGLWGDFKRNIRKNHIKISAKYVQLYVNEACWRYNSKNKSQMELFNEILNLTFWGMAYAKSEPMSVIEGEISPKQKGHDDLFSMPLRCSKIEGVLC